MKVKIRRGGRYGQDHGFDIIDDELSSIMFQASPIKGTNLYKCVAPGYGGEPYGNGAIFVNKSNLIKIEE